MNGARTVWNTANPDIPVYGVVAERRALLDVLAAVRHHRLTLVSAPPGYGKTTAIADYVRRAELPAAWHSLQERERDLPALFAHALQSLEFIAPGISVAATGLTAPDECASYIAGYLREHLQRPSIYVLDDLHYLTAAPQAERWLRELVRQLPPLCHMVLISRALPDLPLAELIARGDVLAIGQEQLKFTVEDAGDLAQKVNAGLSVDTLKTRVTQLEGWPVGVAMSLRPLPEDLQNGLLRGGDGPEGLFDALAMNLLRSLPRVLADFLLASSTVSRITLDICTEVLELPQSTSSMADVMRRNLFVSQMSGGLLMHRLFRNFLQRRLKETDPARFVRLHERAAAWHLREQQDDEAFDHYVEAERIKEALGIVQRTHSAYYQQGNMETLLHWRERLGDHALRLPQFVYTCAMILTDRYLYTDAMHELDAAEQGFLREEEEKWVAETRLQRALIHIRRSEFRAARALTEPIAAQTSLQATTVGHAKHLLALVEMASGDFTKAIDLLENILPIYERNNGSFYVANVLQDLAIAYTRSGNIEKASHCLQRLVSIRRTAGQSNALALALNNLGFYYHQIGDYDLALHTLDEGIRVIGQTNNQRAEGYILWSMGDLQRDLGNDEVATRLYDSAYELSNGAEPVLQQSVSLSMATMCRWRGDYPLAQLHVRDVMEDLKNADAPSSDILLMAEANGMALAAFTGNAPTVMQDLSALVEKLDAQPLSAEYVQVVMLAAQTAFHCGDEAHALAFLRKCIKACEQGMSRNIIAAELLNTPGLLALIERKPEFKPLNAAVERLRTARNAMSPSQPRPQVKLVEPNPGETRSLRVLTLGEETIERDGETVPSSDWRSTRAKEFFFYILFEGPVGREELSLLFWPDSSTARVRSNFHTTLYRARQAVGENVIQFENGGYRINPDVRVWCDALVFRKYVREAQTLPYSDVRADDLYRKAVEYYRGDFLTGMDAEWIIPLREQLYEMHIDALIGAGHCARARQDFDYAVSLFKRALKIDPYREEAYRALFACYAGMGELNRVLKQYNVMSSLFENELGIQPSPETLAYVQQLTQHIS